MKITEVPAPYLLMVLSPPACGGASTLVIVDTDEGIRGIGECFRLAHEAMQTFIAAALRPLMMGKDLRCIEEAAA